ncbi:hypothetical protein CL653_02295 [bacterium]|nr:hypothetical protein [bacterium]
MSRKKTSEEKSEQPASSPKALERAAERCPHCESTDFVRRGVRKNKYQTVQLYLCRKPECGKTFTSRTIKGKQFPWPLVLDGVSYHNLGYTFAQTADILEGKHGMKPQPDTIASWYEEYKPLCRFERLRPYAMKILNNWNQQAKERAVRSKSKESAEKLHMVETVTLAHRQLYRFRYHRPKLLLTLEEYRNRNFGRLMEYLDSVASDTPHQFFADGERMSEVKSKFDKSDMLVRGKNNFANKFTKFVLQAVPRNIDRHEVLQRFMIANDSVTVATEVPVYIRKEDVAHFEKVLKFKVTSRIDGSTADIVKADVATGTSVKGKKVNTAKSSANFGSEADNDPFATDGYITFKGHKRPQPFPELLTGHIDIVQVRNGIVHILDYKPNAAKEKPIEQLTWYALSLSRLTGLRLFEFKCAWFDEHDYFEFYPLHVVKKLNRKRTKKVRYRDGRVATIPKDDELHVIR